MKRLRTVRRIASKSKAAPLVTSEPLAFEARPWSMYREPRRTGSLCRSREARKRGPRTAAQARFGAQVGWPWPRGRTGVGGVLVGQDCVCGSEFEIRAAPHWLRSALTKATLASAKRAPAHISIDAGSRNAAG